MIKFRIKAVLEAKLNETGWKDQVKDQAKGESDIGEG